MKCSIGDTIFDAVFSGGLALAIAIVFVALAITVARDILS